CRRYRGSRFTRLVHRQRIARTFRTRPVGRPPAQRGQRRSARDRRLFARAFRDRARDDSVRMRILSGRGEPPMRSALLVLVLSAIAVSIGGCAPAPVVPERSPVADAARSPVTPVTKIQHVLVLIQENRSFDNFFATFPGADGTTHGRLNGSIVALTKAGLLDP